ncbi:hypothetical protein QYE76_000717 [Lolium multiflorum]|uniref:C3H1-type domain-containing protein n=1 Tax=Lolium multiflorum TaxID=4521 RepID=A0AAD8VWN1_LOLMU|nr:hypothetical protein QYE76_000717 [Lolium multiflorum]
MNFGNRRVHNRLGPAPGAASSSSSSGKVCHHWRVGRCNRFPCPFLHSELPEATANSSRPNQTDGPGAGGHVWRNPNSGGGGGGRGGSGSNRWGRGPGGADVAARNWVQDRPCKYFLAGEHCSYGERCRYPHTYCMSNSITLLTPLQGHEKVVTGIALPNGSRKLYSWSRDGTVRLWDCQTGQVAEASLNCILPRTPSSL